MVLQCRAQEVAGSGGWPALLVAATADTGRMRRPLPTRLPALLLLLLPRLPTPLPPLAGATAFAPGVGTKGPSRNWLARCIWRRR